MTARGGPICHKPGVAVHRKTNVRSVRWEGEVRQTDGSRHHSLRWHVGDKKLSITKVWNELGYPLRPDMNGEFSEGYSPLPTSNDGTARRSTAAISMRRRDADGEA